MDFVHSASQSYRNGLLLLEIFIFFRGPYAAVLYPKGTFSVGGQVHGGQVS
jgi:hypothetical protein